MFEETMAKNFLELEENKILKFKKPNYIEAG